MVLGKAQISQCIGQGTGAPRWGELGEAAVEIGRGFFDAPIGIVAGGDNRYASHLLDFVVDGFDGSDDFGEFGLAFAIEENMVALGLFFAFCEDLGFADAAIGAKEEQGEAFFAE